MSHRYCVFSGKLEVASTAMLCCHTLLIDDDTRHRSYCLLLLSHAVVDASNLRERAAKNGLEGEIDILLRYLETHGEVEDDRLPAWDEFQRIADGLSDLLTVYLIDGGAMSLRDLKGATKDIELVITDGDAYGQLWAVLMDLGYLEVQSLGSDYRALGATSCVENADGCRLDIFNQQVANKLVMTEGMRKRSEPFLATDRLTARLVSNKDIFLFKLIAGRDDDIEDMNMLVQVGVDYDVVRGRPPGNYGRPWGRGGTSQETSIRLTVEGRQNCHGAIVDEDGRSVHLPSTGFQARDTGIHLRFTTGPEITAPYYESSPVCSPNVRPHWLPAGSTVLCCRVRGTAWPCY